MHVSAQSLNNFNIFHFAILINPDFATTNQSTIVISSSSDFNVCMGDVITFTCKTYYDPYLEGMKQSWKSDQLIGVIINGSRIEFANVDSHGKQLPTPTGDSIGKFICAENHTKYQVMISELTSVITTLGMITLSCNNDNLTFTSHSKC